MGTLIDRDPVGHGERLGYASLRQRPTLVEAKQAGLRRLWLDHQNEVPDPAPEARVDLGQAPLDDLVEVS